MQRSGQKRDAGVGEQNLVDMFDAKLPLSWEAR